MTKTPNNIVIMAVKLTRNASDPYFASPELSRNVSFSRNPSAVFPIAKIYTINPNKTCQGSDTRLISDVPPGKKKTRNP